MPLIPLNTLSNSIRRARARWQPGTSWVDQLSDAQRARLLGVVVDRADLAAIRAGAARSRPDVVMSGSVDWRNRNGQNYVSPVKDQADCGACVSFCVCGLVESMAAIEWGVTFADLSEADLHFCSSHGASCDGWWPSSAFEECKTRGVVDENSFPYPVSNGQVSAECEDVDDRAHKAMKIASSTALVSSVERKVWLETVGPLCAVFHVYNDFFSYQSGTYSHVAGDEVGYHCVEVVGYSDLEGCWICKNSWNTTWGDGGFFKIAYGQCGIDDTSTDQDSSGNVLQFPMWGAQYVALAPPDVKVRAPIAANLNSDGRLEVFVADNHKAVWHMWQAVPHAGPWSILEALDGGVKELTSAVNGDGRLELFAIGTDDALWHAWQQVPHGGPWSGWSSLGGKFKHIAVARNRDSNPRLEVFGIAASNNSIQHIWQTQPNGPWSGWESLGGSAKQVAAALNSDGRLEVCIVGTNNSVLHNFQTVPGADPWSGWLSLGGLAKQIITAMNSDGRLEVLITAPNDSVRHNFQTVPHAGPWSGWLDLGGNAKQLAAALNADGRLEVFALAANKTVQHIWQTVPHAGPWSAWESLGGSMKEIAVARNSDGRLEVFGLGTDNSLSNTWQPAANEGPWSGWATLAG